MSVRGGLTNGPPVGASDRRPVAGQRFGSPATGGRLRCNIPDKLRLSRLTPTRLRPLSEPLPSTVSFLSAQMIAHGMRSWPSMFELPWRLEASYRQGLDGDPRTRAIHSHNLEILQLCKQRHVFLADCSSEVFLALSKLVSAGAREAELLVYKRNSHNLSKIYYHTSATRHSGNDWI